MWFSSSKDRRSQPGSYTSAEFVTPEECADIIEWMIRQPGSWSGQIVEIPEARHAMKGAGTLQ